VPPSEAAIFEGKSCRIVPKTPIHFGSVLQIAGMPVDAEILRWLDHGILIEGNMFVPWSNIVTITPLEGSDGEEAL
jgi:hypothetical protein